MLGQNNRADKLGSIPKERGHSLTEETPQFICFHLLGSVRESQTEQPASSTEDSPDLWRCPKCGGPMKVMERLTAAEIQLRSPPGIRAGVNPWNDTSLY